MAREQSQSTGAQSQLIESVQLRLPVKGKWAGDANPGAGIPNSSLLPSYTHAKQGKTIELTC